MTNKTTNNLKKLTGTAVLVAIAAVLQYIEISVPVMPAFIKLDFSDLPEIIGAFAFGPCAGVLVALFKNVIHMAVSQSGFVGELSNFVLGAVFAFTAGMIYKKSKTVKNAVFAGVIASLAMAAASLPLNFFVIYPLYYSVLGFPEEAVLDMYKVILPETKSIFYGLLIFNVPFTFIKGLACTFFACLVLKPLQKVIQK